MKLMILKELWFKPFLDCPKECKLYKTCYIKKSCRLYKIGAQLEKDKALIQPLIDEAVSKAMIINNASHSELQEKAVKQAKDEAYEQGRNSIIDIIKLLIEHLSEGK
jgi:hypothetical protein